MVIGKDNCIDFMRCQVISYLIDPPPAFLHPRLLELTSSPLGNPIIVGIFNGVSIADTFLSLFDVGYRAFIHFCRDSVLVFSYFLF
jgi:hypothetical protein